jgi:hypothetical protein
MVGNEDWFIKVRKYRNQATHHYTVPLASRKTGWGDTPLDFSEHDVSIIYRQDTGNIIDEDITVCKEYLIKMINHISSIWEYMSSEFDKRKYQ